MSILVFAMRKNDWMKKRAKHIVLICASFPPISSTLTDVDASALESYISLLHQTYKPKTVKRKIASLKAFYHFLKYKDYFVQNPFNRLQIHFRELVKLPKTIPLQIVERLLETIYAQRASARTPYQRRNALRDAAVIELLFASGMRISGRCALQPCNIHLTDGVILIYGKGAKERRLQNSSPSVLRILREYYRDFCPNIREKTSVYNVFMHFLIY